MSCSNSCDGTGFDKLNQTWNGKNTMDDPGSYEPYPELLNPRGGQYYIPLQNSIITNVKAKGMKEGYCSRACQPTPYQGMNRTWGGQKKYTL